MYKLGESFQKDGFLELRQEAEIELGDQFELKQFHNAVLQNGSMPLEVLEKTVDEFIRQSLQDNQSVET